MKKIEDLCTRILQSESLVEPQLDFSILCMQSGLTSEEADSIFYSEFGMSGAEVLRCVHSGHQEALL